MNKTLALVLGIAFLLVGILGFLTVSGHGMLLGLFMVDPLHNLIHVATGLLALIAVRKGWPRTFNRAFGITYFLIGVLGLFALDAEGRLFGLLHLNGADNGLHLVTGGVAALTGFLLDRGPVEETPHARPAAS